MHWVTRIKVVKEPALADTSRTEAEKSRGRDHAAKIGMAHLTRAWSMLLKGIRETELHADPLMAAEMVLIRLAHAADLPGGEELAKLVRSAPQSADRIVALPPREPLRSGEPHGDGGQAALAVKPQPAVEAAAAETRAFSSFRDIIALLTEKRLIKLKADIERFVGRSASVPPVRTGAGARRPSGASWRDRRNLEAQTGQRWMVMVAKDGGEKPVLQQRQENRDSLFRSAREHPDVQAVLKRFRAPRSSTYASRIVRHHRQPCSERE